MQQSVCREAVAERENVDVAELEGRLDRKLDRAERSRVGVTQLRRWLEKLLQRRHGALREDLRTQGRHALRRLFETAYISQALAGGFSHAGMKQSRA